MATKAKSKGKAKAPTLKIRKGDRVQVLAGKDRGAVGEVIRVDSATQRVYVEGAKIQKVANKPRATKDQKNTQLGGIIEREGPIHVSNVALIDPKDKRPTRISVVREQTGRSRLSRRSGERLD